MRLRARTPADCDAWLDALKRQTLGKRLEAPLTAGVASSVSADTPSRLPNPGGKTAGGKTAVLQAKLETLKERKRRKKMAQNSRSIREHLRTYSTPSSSLDLPNGWQSAKTADGEVYYYNRQTNERTWVRPTNLSTRPHSNVIPGKSGWFLVATDDGDDAAIHLSLIHI